MEQSGHEGGRPRSRAESGGTSDTRAFPCGQVREECSSRHEAFAVGDRRPQDRHPAASWGRPQFPLRLEAGASRRDKAGDRKYEKSATEHHIVKVGGAGEDGVGEELLLGVARLSRIDRYPSLRRHLLRGSFPRAQTWARESRIACCRWAIWDQASRLCQDLREIWAVGTSVTISSQARGSKETLP